MSTTRDRNMTEAPRRPNGPQRRLSLASDSSESSTPERELDDDYDSIMDHANDSQSSLGVSFEEMDLDRAYYEAQCRLAPINRLPAELLIAVFSKLSSATDIKNCMLVSRSWARNAVDLLWYRPSTHCWKNLLNVIQTARRRDGFFAYHDLIKRLNLSQLGEMVSDGTLQPITACKRIERMTLTNCRMLTDLSVSALIQGNRNLLALDVSNLENITDQSLMVVAQNCYKLQGLNVTKCVNITDESLVAIARNCRRVKRLKFNDCAQLTDYSIMAFADNCHDMLEVDCHGCRNLTDDSVTALISQARQLREVRLAHCSRITDEAFLKLPSDQIYNTLRILDLTDCHELQDAGIQKIVSAAPRMRNIVLAKCTQITDKGVMAVARLGKNLHYIHLGHCFRITDAGVTALVRYCNRIRYIDLACCQHLTDASVSLLAQLPKLKRIGLVKCIQISDASILALATPTRPGQHHTIYPNMLERLHLSYCSRLTIHGVRAMLMNCPRLTHLSLTGVRDFLADDLLAFCRDAPAEFNEHQRDVFCVFSGEGVHKLREHLQEAYPTPPASEPDTDLVDNEHENENEYEHNTDDLATSGERTPPEVPLHGQTEAMTPTFQESLAVASQHNAHGNVPPPPPTHVLPPHLSFHPPTGAPWPPSQFQSPSDSSSQPQRQSWNGTDSRSGEI